MKYLIVLLFVFLSGAAVSQPGDTAKIKPLDELKASTVELKQSTEVLKNIPVVEPAEKTRVVIRNRVKRVKVTEIKEVPVLASEQKILLRIDSTLIYEVQPTEFYRGYVILDLSTDSLPQLVQQPDTIKKRSAFYRFFHKIF